MAAETVKLPQLSRAPESGAVDLDDDFFSSDPTAAAGDIFAGVDGAASADEPLDLGAMMKESVSPARVRQPTKAEMQALRQEFSVVARLEKHKRKRWLYVGLAAAAILGIVVAVVIFAPSRDLEYAGRGTSADEAVDVERPLYEVQVEAEAEVAEVDTEAEGASVGGEAAGRLPKSGAANPRTGAGGSKVATTSKTPSTPVKTTSKISAERFAALTRDEVGKSEVKLDFDSTEAARKAESEAAEKRSARSGELAEEVGAAFGKKKAQFGRCSDANQEKVRMFFTVTITGKVVNVDVQGTNSGAKKACIKELLERAVFPAGDEPLTYSQVLVL